VARGAVSPSFGFLRLGLDPHVLEEIAPGRCTDGTQSTSFANSANLAFFRRAVAQLGLDGPATLVCGENEETEGLAFDELHGHAEAAELLRQRH